MGSVTCNGGHWSYDMLKEIAAKEECSHKDLEDLKTIFAKEIGSQRRLDCIRSVAELIDSLERLNIISEYNVEPMHEIAERNCPKLDEALAGYVPRKETTAPEPINQYQEQRLADELQQQLRLSVGTAPTAHYRENVAVAVTNPLPSPCSGGGALTENKRAAIAKLLAAQLGKYWRSFGRELEIGEGTMDDIELKFPSDSCSRVYKLLQVFEEDPCHDPKQSILIICRALAACRRKDLRTKVENIMSH